MTVATRALRVLAADIAFGLCASTFAFAATAYLGSILGETYFTLMVAAVAGACWYRGPRSGIAASVAGIAGVVLLLPPVYTFRVEFPDGVIRLGVFCLTAALVCGISLARERSSRRLRLIEGKYQEAEQWLEAAQRSTRFWTWEIDPDRSFVQWDDPYGELRSHVYESVESWLLDIHPDDRARCKTALEQATATNGLALEFRTNEPDGGRSLVAKGILVTNSDTNARRLVGVSVERNGAEATLLESQFALFGITELLATLADNPSLDRRTRSNVYKARQVVRTLLPQPAHQPSAV